jgi:hypothetical protein
MTIVRRSRRILTTTIVLLFLIPIFACAQVAWVQDFNAALKQAAKEKKFIVIDISASW